MSSKPRSPPVQRPPALTPTLSQREREPGNDKGQVGGSPLPWPFVFPTGGGLLNPVGLHRAAELVGDDLQGGGGLTGGADAEDNQSVQVTLFGSPFQTRTAVDVTALFVQDSYTVKRLTVTGGLRAVVWTEMLQLVVLLLGGCGDESPDVLALDEPTAELDGETARAGEGLARRRGQRQDAFIIDVHGAEEVGRLLHSVARDLPEEAGIFHAFVRNRFLRCCFFLSWLLLCMQRQGSQEGNQDR